MSLNHMTEGDAVFVRRRLYALVLIVVLGTLSTAGLMVPAASATSSSACARALKAETPAQVELSVLQRYVANGWNPTAAGKALLSTGQLPAADAAVVAGGSQSGTMVLAKGPVVARSIQAVRRVADQDHVFLDCGINQRANVTYTTTPASYAFVAWYEENFQTGDARYRDGPSSYCDPSPGDCLVYAYDKPPSPWFVFDATAHSTGTVYIEDAYCGG